MDLLEVCPILFQRYKKLRAENQARLRFLVEMTSPITQRLGILQVGDVNHSTA